MVSWPQRTDKSGALVRKYCPELKDFPDKVNPRDSLSGSGAKSQYIYAPHTAPESVQKAAKCIIGKDYPSPILDERAEKDRCIAKIKNAYKLNLHGDSPEVLDGSAPEMLRKIHEETGAAETKGKEEREEEKRVEKRKKSGDGNLDSFVKKRVKA